MSAETCTTHHACDCITAERDRLRTERDRIFAKIRHIERGGCCAAHPGEHTYECRPERVCVTCRLRYAEAETARLRTAIDSAAAHLPFNPAVALAKLQAALPDAGHAKMSAPSSRGGEEG